MDFQRIQERAYALWVEEGYVDGRADEHWLRAERELSYMARARGEREQGEAQEEGAGEAPGRQARRIAFRAG